MLALLDNESHFGLGRALLTPDDVVAHAAAQGCAAVGLADYMSVDGVVSFTAAAKKHGVKPIIGCRLAVHLMKDTAGETATKSYGVGSIIAYPKNAAGFTELLQLLSLAHCEPRAHRGVGRIWPSDLLALAASGNHLFLLSPDEPMYRWPEFEDVLLTLARMSRERGEPVLSLPVLQGKTPLHVRINTDTMEWSDRLLDSYDYAAPLIYCGAAKYKHADEAHASAYDTFRASATQSFIRSTGKLIYRRYARDDAPVSVDVASTALECTGIVAADMSEDVLEHLEYVWEPMPVSLPRTLDTITDDDSEYEHLVDLVLMGIETRLGQSVLGYQPSDEDIVTRYQPRIRYELEVLKSMGFCRYFLVVADLVNYAKNRGILVGPGRGSVGGSIVAYLMGITDVDPIRFDLLFERFINPERLDLPDADIDFESARRHEVHEYLVERYGADCVANVTNYVTAQPSSAFRRAAMVHGLPPGQQNLSVQIQAGVDLESAAANIPAIAVYKAENPRAFSDAVLMTGFNAGFSVHAGGVIVTDSAPGERLADRSTVVVRKETPCVSWDKHSVEGFGLVKIDMLSISTLDGLSVALKLLGDKVDLTQLPLDDELTLKGFEQGETIGVFQFESRGMRRLLVDMARKVSRTPGSLDEVVERNPLNFMDLAVATALYRPGPMESGMMAEYVANRQVGAEVSVIHPDMKPILSKTIGAMVFQEQVMEVARVIAGFSLAEADLLRRAIGKKDADKMAALRDDFVSRCVSYKGLAAHDATHLFDNIEKFASYSFNASHSVAYSLISYQCMYLKQHHPVEFYCGLMNSATAKGDFRLRTLIADAKANGIMVLPPDINQSQLAFAPSEHEGKRCIVAPLSVMRGLAEKGATKAIHARESLPGAVFTSREHFSASVDRRSINKTVVAALEAVGGFRSLDDPSDPEYVSVMDESRRGAQLESCPGIIVDFVRADRVLDVVGAKDGLIDMHTRINKCDRCALACGKHYNPANTPPSIVPMPSFGKRPMVMVVLEDPAPKEVGYGRMMAPRCREEVLRALRASDLSPNDCYFTTTQKARRAEKQPINPDHVSQCLPYLLEEIELLKPAVILALGTKTLRAINPDLKGNAQDLNGQIVWMPKLNAALVCGISPGMIYFNPEAQEELDHAFEVTASLCPTH